MYDPKKVWYAVKRAYEECGDGDYAKRKANAFMHRCLTIVEIVAGIDEQTLNNICFSMLDERTADHFWSYLGEEYNINDGVQALIGEI
jgi:hypothetical protein